MINVNTYEEMRDAVKDGDIVFFRKSPSLMGKIIRWFTVSPYDHVAIAFWITSASNKRLMLVEAQGGTKRRIINASFYSDRDVDVVKAMLPWEDMEENVLAQIGITEYSYADAAAVGIKEALKKRLGISVGKIPDLSDSEEICSELVHNILRCSEELLSPGELFHCLVEHGAQFRVCLRHKKGRD